MRWVSDRIGIEANFEARLFERGKYVWGSLREGHNVFTTVGRDWLAHLSAWQTVGGGGDVPFTNRRVRWMGLGTGTQLEVEGVTALNAPTPVTTGVYLGAVQEATFPTTTSVEFVKEFGTGEISLPGDGLPIVAVTEAGLFVDVFPVSTNGGVDDSAVGAGDTTLNVLFATNAPIAYHTFEEINKTVDFSLVIRWTLIFG